MIRPIAFIDTCEELRQNPKTWFVTGAAGFIGSNLVETLLKLEQRVVGLDNFSTGYHQNLKMAQKDLTPQQRGRFEFIEGDVRNLTFCRYMVGNVDYVLHQAALGSVPKSIEDPVTTNASNITGHLNMLVASRDAGVKRMVYAASSSTYGDEPTLPKVEEKIGKPLSPYAVTKYVNELYADVFAKIYGLESIGLRYFNVFGPRQDPNGAYAAVIPKWINAMLNNENITINGDGSTTRDFCYIDNVVQANILAAIAPSFTPVSPVYNVAVGDRTTLNNLFNVIKQEVSPKVNVQPTYGPFRLGDVFHSQASIKKIQSDLRYVPTHTFAEGMKETIKWFINNPKHFG